jgi:PAS domain S-box-containing protein
MAFDHLQDYARFLLENLLDELTACNVARAREVALPLLKLFAQYSEAQLFDYSRNSLRELLTQLAAGTAVQYEAASLQRWKTGGEPGVPADQIDARDLAFTPHTRKYAFIKLLRRYTRDLDVYEAVVQDIELFYATNLGAALEAFVEIGQDKLRKEKDLLRTVIDNTEDGITIYDHEYRVTLWNRAVEARSGIAGGQIIGKKFFDVFPVYRDTPDGQAMQRALEGHRIRLSDMPYRLREGYYESDLLPLRDEEGAVRGVLAISRDITRQKEALTKVSRSEALMARAQEVAHFGSWEWNLLTGELAWSDEMYRIYGYEPGSVKATAEWSFSHYFLEDLAATRQTLEALKAQPQPFQSAHRIVRRDGAVRDIQVVGAVETDAAGRAVKLYGASQDVTQARQAEAQLRQHRHFIERIADTTPNLLYIYDLKRNQNVYANRELYRQLGYTAEWVQQTGAAFLPRVVHPDDFPEVLRSFSELAAAGDADIVQVEYRIRTAAGDWRWFYDRATVFSRDPDGSVRETLGTSQDITEQKRSQQALHEKNEALSRALAELRTTRDSLLHLNNALEQKVTERTGELAASELELRQTLDQAIALNKRLRDRENFLASIIDQTPVSTWIADAEGTQIQVNRACLDLFGVEDPGQGLGKYNLFRDNTLADHPGYGEIRAVFREGKVLRFEVDYDLSKVTHVQVPTGRAISLVVTIFPVKDADGRVVNAVVQHEDVTARKKAEEALRYQSRLMRTITDNATSALLMIDPQGYCTFMNPAGEKMFGFSFEEIRQQPLHCMIHHHRLDGSFYPMEECPLGQTLTENAPMLAHEDVFIRKDGTFFPVSCAASPVFENGAPAATVIEVRDITGEKEAQARLVQVNSELRGKNAELQRINADLDNFIYAASHDLRAPIANLESILTMLRKRLTGRLDATEAPLLEFAATAIGRLKQTIKDLTEISKVQRETDEPAEEVAFGEMLHDVQLDIAGLITGSGAIIRTDFAVPSVHYARKNIRSILYNLLSNAIKYRSPERPPEVTILTRREDGQVVLRVEDNGLGIPAGQLPKVFSMFKRFHAHVEGTGIGLYIVKRVVENGGGRIEVASEEGRGTAFTLYFKEP